jgi:polyisoprenoid-binding protein YceI
MKNFKTLALLVTVAFSTATLTAQIKTVNASKSTITWVGKKVTGQHEGTIKLKEGAFFMKDGKITRGKFTVDMTSIEVTDIKAGEGKEKLEGHLKADDFFGTEKFATANMNFKSVTPKANGVYTVVANLTIKGITNPVTFDLTVKDNVATAKVVVDRTKYDIKYSSGSFFENLGDKVISDNFDLTVSLQF